MGCLNSASDGLLGLDGPAGSRVSCMHITSSWLDAVPRRRAFTRRPKSILFTCMAFKLAFLIKRRRTWMFVYICLPRTLSCDYRYSLPTILLGTCPKTKSDTTNKMHDTHLGGARPPSSQRRSAMHATLELSSATPRGCVHWDHDEYASPCMYVEPDQTYIGLNLIDNRPNL